jgi:triosephosphate isomerase (TIM)
LRKPIIAGNWKMYKTVQESTDFARRLDSDLKGVADREILVCPTALALAAVADALRFSGIQVGAQDAHWEDEGAYTGNVSPAMILEAGAKYAILGHSERRQYDNDTDERINRKLKNVLKNGLRAVLCVGETWPEREAGRTEAVVGGQLAGCLRGIGLADLASMVVAYEPVWAIGTGKTATPEQANEVHAFIRGFVGNRYNREAADQIRIQYGGSVKPDNIKELMAQPDIDGALVGGASLKAESFAAIVRY